MRSNWFVIVVAIVSFAINTETKAQTSQPATQPVRPPSRMNAQLTGPVSFKDEVPLTLGLFSESDGERHFSNYSFMFVLLDEQGNQVGGPHVFIREAITIDLKLDGKESTYKPRLKLYHEREGLFVGRRYQLVCLMPQCDLASSVWFTLAQ